MTMGEMVDRYCAEAKPSWVAVVRKVPGSRERRRAFHALGDRLLAEVNDLYRRVKEEYSDEDLSQCRGWHLRLLKAAMHDRSGMRNKFGRTMGWLSYWHRKPENRPTRPTTVAGWMASQDLSYVPEHVLASMRSGRWDVAQCKSVANAYRAAFV